MKKILVAILIPIVASISGYYMFIWNPETTTTEAKINEIDSNIKEYKTNNTDKVEKKKSVKLKDSTKTFEENMINGDKNQINNYKNKLSVIDSALIDEYMDSKEDEDSIREMIRIFKYRLIEEDYNNVKLILNKYIDVNSLEKELS